jgi:hypothetical protein
MVELAKSAVRVPWAASVFGVQQLVNLLSKNGGTKAPAAFYSATKAVQGEFEDNPLLFGINQLGDLAQRRLVDFSCDFLRLKPLDPEWLAGQWADVMQEAVGMVRALTPGENLRYTVEELRNTMAVINLVNRTSDLLKLPPGEIDLPAALDRAYSAGGDYATLWLVEGLGEEYANRNWSIHAPVRGLLVSDQGAALPQKCLLMMHAGIGISFARHILTGLTPYSPEAEVSAAVQRFVSLVRTNSRPGYEGPGFESLGLVTRAWYQPMVAVIDRQLWNIDQEVLEYFWHGVGRSIYFSPQYLVPCATAFQGVAREAPHELARLNGTAGAAWAFSLVNIRQPEITANLLANHSPMFASDDAFSDGLVSTLMMASDMLPGDPHPAKFCGYRPQTNDPSLQAMWDRLVRVPCNRALQEYLPVLRNRGELGQVFRYQQLSALLRKPEMSE